MLNERTNDLERARDFFAVKLAFVTGVAELSGMIRDAAEINIIDVRAAADYAKGHVPGAINLPRERWASEAGLTKDRPNVVYCYSQTCKLAAKAALEFATRGYPVIELEGGFDTWQAHGKPVDRGAAAAAR